MTDYRRLPPVDGPPPLPARLSYSLLSRFDACPRSAYLDLTYSGGAPSHDMHRGSVFHEFAERAMWTLIEQGEDNLVAAIDGEEDPVRAKRDVASLTAAIVDEVVRDCPDLPVRARDIDRVREMAYHWAVGCDISPRRVLGVEQKYVLDMGTWTVVGKVDVVSAHDEGLQIDDYKTSFYIPSQEEFEHGFQLRMYAALVAFGQPVEKAEDGTERRLDPVGHGVSTFRVREVYPAYLDDEGRLRYRETFLDRTALSDFLVDLQTRVDGFQAAVASGLWPAVPGSHCGRCPAVGECPLPGVLRDRAGEITSPEEAAAALAYVTVEERRLQALKKDAKRFAPVRVGDEVWEIRVSESTSTDVDKLAQAVDFAFRTGEVVRVEDFQKKRVSSRFAKRRLSPEELTSDQEGEAA